MKIKKPEPIHEFMSQIILNDLVEKLDDLKKSGECNQQKYLDLAQEAADLNINFTQGLNIIKSRAVETQRDVIRYVWDLESMNFN